MTDAERDLAATHAATAARNARVMTRRFRSIDPHEIAEACDRALMIAAARHDPDRGAFATCLHWETRDQVSKVVTRQRRRRVWPAKAPDQADPDPGPHERAAANERAAAVDAATGRLSPAQRSSVREHFGFAAGGQTVSRQARHKALTRGLARLSVELYDAGVLD